MLRRLLRSRQPSQGVVEYGLLVVVVAVVALIGLNALAQAQRAYFTGEAVPELAPQQPTVPGQLLHPTIVDAPVCSPTTFYLGQTSPAFITCYADVHDVWQAPAERTPPNGPVHATRNGVPFGACFPPLAPITSSTSRCTWTVSPVSAQVGMYAVTAQFGPWPPPPPPPPTIPIQSNHWSSAISPPSAAITIYQYQLLGGHHGGQHCKAAQAISPPWERVEIGHPAICFVQVLDQGNPRANVTVEWRTNNTPAGSGDGILSCFTDFSRELVAPPPPPPYPLNLDTHPLCTDPMLNGQLMRCVTDANGRCGVVYRRLNNAMTAPSTPVTHTIMLTVPSLSMSANWTIDTIPPQSPHRTNTIVLCDDNPPVTTNETDRIFFDLTLRNTNSIAVTGTAPSTVTCHVTVIDMDPTPLTAGGTNTDTYDAYPPVGIVRLRDSNGTIIMPDNPCNLLRNGLPYPNQDTGQAPLTSKCDFTDIPISSSTAVLAFDYEGNGGSLEHAPSSAAIGVSFGP